jgi:hypothetical protein
MFFGLGLVDNTNLNHDWETGHPAKEKALRLLLAQSAPIDSPLEVSDAGNG